MSQVEILEKSGTAKGAGTMKTLVLIDGHSLAYRMARVADGGIDGGIANAGAHDWDIAAAHAILNEAGGELLSVGGIVPSYNKPSTIHGMIAAGHKPLAHKLTVALSVSSETAAKVF